MNKKLWLMPVLMAISLKFVLAIDVLDAALRPFRETNIAALYGTYVLFVDAVIYTILFISLAQMVYVKAFGKKEGKLVAVAIGLALMFGMMILEKNTGFNLGQLGPLAAIILLFILGILLYNLFQGMFNDAAASFSLTFLIMYAILMSAFNLLYKWLEKNAPLLAAIINIAMVAAFIILLIRVIRMFGGGGNNNNGGGNQGGNNNNGGGNNQGGGNQPQPAVPNTLTITSPTPNQNFNAGDIVRVAFNVAGPGFANTYNYQISDRGTNRVVDRVENVRGNQVYPGLLRAGSELVPGNHIFQVAAMSRGFFGGGNVIALSEFVPFTVGGAGAGPGDLVDLITNNLDTLIAQLTAAYNNYALIFNTIVQMHNNAFRGAGPDAGPAEWAALITARDEMRRLGREINDLLRAINAHPQYGALTAVHLGVLAANVRRNTNIRRAIIQYEIQARDDYNNHRAPRAPPAPGRP